MSRAKNKSFFVSINFFLFLGSSFLSNHLSGNIKEEQNVTFENEVTIYITKGVLIYDAQEINKKKSFSDQNKSASKPISHKISSSKIDASKERVRKLKVVHPPVKSKFNFNSIASTQQFGVIKNLSNSNFVTPPNSFGKAFISLTFSENLIPLFFFLLNTYTVNFSKAAQYSHFLFPRPPPQRSLLQSKR